jgi:hypothetical protein
MSVFGLFLLLLG